EPVALDERARARMLATRAIVSEAVATGAKVYGTTTGVGVLKQIPVAAPDVVRATMVRLANHVAEGSPGVRPELADGLIRALNDDETPNLLSIGSVGQ